MKHFGKAMNLRAWVAVAGVLLGDPCRAAPAATTEPARTMERRSRPTRPWPSPTRRRALVAAPARCPRRAARTAARKRRRRPPIGRTRGPRRLRRIRPVRSPPNAPAASASTASAATPPATDLRELHADRQGRHLLAGQERRRQRLRGRLDLRRHGFLPQGSRSELFVCHRVRVRQLRGRRLLLHRRVRRPARPAWSWASKESARRSPGSWTTRLCNGTNTCDGLGECRRKNGSTCGAAARLCVAQLRRRRLLQRRLRRHLLSCNQAQSPGRACPSKGRGSVGEHALRRQEHLRRQRQRQPACKLKNGQTCATNADCASGTCRHDRRPTRPERSVRLRVYRTPAANEGRHRHEDHQNCVYCSFALHGVQARSRGAVTAGVAAAAATASQGLHAGHELRAPVSIAPPVSALRSRPPRPPTTPARWTSIARSATTATSAPARTTAWRIGTAPQVRPATSAAAARRPRRSTSRRPRPRRP